MLVCRCAAYMDRIKEGRRLICPAHLRPVYPDSMTLVKHTDTSDRIVIEVYPSMALDKRTLKLATTEHSHFHMPITKAKIDPWGRCRKLAGLAQEFLDDHFEHSERNYFRDEHSLHGEIVLYATQLSQSAIPPKSMGSRNMSTP